MPRRQGGARREDPPGSPSRFHGWIRCGEGGPHGRRGLIASRWQAQRILLAKARKKPGAPRAGARGRGSEACPVTGPWGLRSAGEVARVPASGRPRGIGLVRRGRNEAAAPARARATRRPRPRHVEGRQRRLPGSLVARRDHEPAVQTSHQLVPFGPPASRQAARERRLVRLEVDRTSKSVPVSAVENLGRCPRVRSRESYRDQAEVTPTSAGPPDPCRTDPARRCPRASASFAGPGSAWRYARPSAVESSPSAAESRPPAGSRRSGAQ